jgi:catechol 2,3-dioxygenase-like lactoylglutathione lyase family enzyme
MVHHSAICVSDIESSLRFWRDGLGFLPLMDAEFSGDWPFLLGAPTSNLRSVFLGDPQYLAGGVIELVDLGEVPNGAPYRPGSLANSGFLLLSVMADVNRILERLDTLGLGGAPRRISAQGVAMAVVVDPDGVMVELVDISAMGNLEQLTDPESTR